MAAAIKPIRCDSRTTRLFVILASFLAVNALCAEFVGSEDLRTRTHAGLDTFNWNLFGQSGSLSFTSGVLLWPFVFLMTDIINEYFGRRGVQFISWLTVALIVYGFIAAYLTISPGPGGILGGRESRARRAGYAGRVQQHFRPGHVDDRRVGDCIPAWPADRREVFHRIRLLTGEKWIWLRATGSTLISQLIDSFVVLYIAFVLGPQKWSIPLFMAVATVNYALQGADGLRC